MPWTKFRSASLILAALLALAFSASAQTDDEPVERIRRFDSHITLNSDATLLVSETIEVVAAGEQVRHGIYRDFPTRYQDRLGNRYTVAFKIIGVQRDGNAEPYHTESTSDGVRIYFGSSDALVSHGLHRYVFTYRTDRQLGFFKNHQELYWNVTGNRWAFPIDMATTTVVLPPQVHNFVRSLEGYTGAEGATGRAFTASRDAEGNPVFRAVNLPPQEGLTIVVTWPPDLIAPPSTQQKVDWFLSDNRAAVAGLIGLAVVVLYYLAAWVKVGRDPHAGTIVPLYDPPDNMSPASMRYLERMAFDEKTFTCAILGLAAKGSLTIDRDESRTYRLVQKSGGKPGELSSEEKTLLRQLFEDGSTLRLTNDHHALISRAKKALSLALNTGMEKVYFLNNAKYFWPGLVLTIVAALAVLFSSGTQMNGGEMAVGIFMTIWLSGWSVGVTVLLTAVIRAWKSAPATGIMGTGGALFLTLFSIPFLLGEAAGLFVLSRTISAVACVMILLMIGANVLFHHLLKAPTQVGRRLLDRIDGFKMFLSAVEGDRMNTLIPPNKTPELFERFLPYALALGVEHAWSEQFSQVLAAAAAAPSSGRGHGYSPSWYTGGFIASSPTAFASSFSSAFSGAVSSASTAPGSSSGSGGGGSSGGGGGGGGGGGW